MAQRDRVVEASANFEAQLERLGPWIKESRGAAIKCLRDRLPEMVEQGEQIDLAAELKDVPIER